MTTLDDKRASERERLHVRSQHLGRIVKRTLPLLAVLALTALQLAPLSPSASAAKRPPLVFAGCIANRGAWGCKDPAHDSLAAASGVAVSPDGANVYVTASFNFEQPSIGGNSVTTFARAPGGALRQEGCLANPSPDAGSAACETVPQASLHGAGQVIVSPDGRNVYALSRGGVAGLPSAITELTRLPDGRLAPLGCIAADTSTGCAEFPHHGTEERTTIQSLAISPDGADVYAVAAESSSANGAGPTSISQFARAADGTLTEVGCIAVHGAGGCAPAPESWTFGAIAVSPDGADLYSLGYESVEQLAIGAGGALSVRGCIARESSYCTRSGTGLVFPSRIAVAPDGATVYAVGATLVQLTRAPDGSLSQSSCLSNQTPKGDLIVPACVAAKRSGIGSAGIVASPDGRVYLTASGQVSAFGHKPDRTLVERGCVANTGRGGRLLTAACARTGHPSLRGAEGVAVSPNGRSIYVASLTGLSVTWLRRPAAQAA
jgi:sugar lactone lactonase YvrE